MDKAWDIPQTDSEWIDRLADRRLGVTNAVARAAWKKMYDKVLTIPSTSFHGTLIENRPSLKSDGKYPDRKFFSANQQQNLVDVWKQLLSIPNVSRDTYRFDVVNIGRQVLGGYFEQLQNKFTSAYESGNVDSLKLVGSEMKAVLKDVDALVACHSTFSLKNWIESARAMGKDAAEKDYYEKNARTLITVWGDTSSLTDYARRGWSGLISNYYAPCWIMFIDKVTACTEQHKVFDEQAFVKECYDLERKFIEPSYPITYVRSGDGIQFARNILKKYGNKLN
jgi:alpha-N-acetylglucosaminidase